jgi:hypothetical protein
MTDRAIRAGEHPVTYGVVTGRFTAARAEYWLTEFQARPEATTAAIESLSPVLAPPGRVLSAQATAGWVVSDEDEFAHLFPPTPEQVDAIQAARAAQVAAMTDDELMDELFGPGDDRE